MRIAALLIAGAFAVAAPASGQLVPDVGGVTAPVGGVISGVVDVARPVTSDARGLIEGRIEALRNLVRANPDRLEQLGRGEIAVRGEVVALDPSEAALAAATRAGFAVITHEEFGDLDLRAVTLRAPSGVSVRAAMARLRKLAPDTAFVPNHVYWRSGAAGPASGESPAGNPRGGTPVGIIDGGASAGFFARQAGFAAGAPAPSAHGTAVASLIVGGGGVRAAAPRSSLHVADVYGSDPAGGNAVAIARALGWMLKHDVAVVSLSLAGPPNALVERAVAAAQARGTAVVAAVGNDGPAAPPSYPASYPGVIAVTGVDAKNRALVEAGRARHVDYAAPGADMLAAGASGHTGSVRGTSFAAPLVAARLLAHYPRRDTAALPAALGALDAEAVDLGRKGADKTFGRGLVCGDCRTRPAS